MSFAYPPQEGRLSASGMREPMSGRSVWVTKTQFVASAERLTFLPALFSRKRGSKTSSSARAFHSETRPKRKIDRSIPSGSAGRQVALVQRSRA